MSRALLTAVVARSPWAHRPRLAPGHDLRRRSAQDTSGYTGADHDRPARGWATTRRRGRQRLRHGTWRRAALHRHGHGCGATASRCDIGTAWTRPPSRRPEQREGGMHPRHAPFVCAQGDSRPPLICSVTASRSRVRSGPAERVAHRRGEPRVRAVALDACHQRPHRRDTRLDIPAVLLEPAVEQVEPGAINPRPDQPRIVDRAFGQPADGEAPEPRRDRSLELLPRPAAGLGPAPLERRRSRGGCRRGSAAGPRGRRRTRPARSRRASGRPRAARAACRPARGRTPGPSDSRRTGRSSR